ncbi:MAG: FAD-binding protein [Gammaproteobacteria bacterium]|nr:FAD-binding protein [Gammaproteobacteria bacterium]MDE2023840.1 FAD-binding protein [Gammaproteobacteria bacterium]MDE2274379.1 FAD-binding protein [Gammaproteobacteria bacterium]
MNKILVVAEHDGKTLNASTARAVNCALAIGGEIDVAVFAVNASAVSTAAGKLKGVKRVLKVERAENAHQLAAVLAPQIAKLAKDYTHVLAPSTTFGKDLLPRAAALLGVQQVSDVMNVIDATTFERPMYAGNAIVTVKAPAAPCILATVRTASWQECGTGGTAEIVSVTTDAAVPAHTRFVGLKAEKSDRPDLQSAPRVVSGGRGVGSKENFAVIYKLADKLHAAVGASRAAVDAGFVSNDLQVGQTGKIIAPELYVAVGISGAIQHLTGIKDARTIVAINKDPDAPIFQVADIGLVGDLFQILPELEKELDEL